MNTPNTSKVARMPFKFKPEQLHSNRSTRCFGDGFLVFSRVVFVLFCFGLVFFKKRKTERNVKLKKKSCEPSEKLLEKLLSFQHDSSLSLQLEVFGAKLGYEVNFSFLFF